MNALLLLLADLKVPAWTLAALLLVFVATIIPMRCQTLAARSETQTCREQGDKLREKAGALQEDDAKCHHVLDEQNAAISSWQAQAEIEQARADVAEARGEQVRTVTVEKVRQIMAEPVSKEPKQALQWGRQEAAVLAKAWSEGRQ